MTKDRDLPKKASWHRKQLVKLKLLIYPRIDLILAMVIVLGALLTTTAATPGAWPSDSQWTILTGGGVPIIDREARGNCTDLSNGGTSPAGANDISSQAKCSGGGAKYNPGKINVQSGPGFTPGTTQPGATNQNTYSAATFYRDVNNDSVSCSNIADDFVFFRVRIAANPVQNNPSAGLTNDYWWSTLDVNGDGIPDFYVRVNGNQGVSGGDPSTTENIQILYETNGDSDPTGEPIIVTYLNPLNTGYARSTVTPDNGIVGDQTEYFLDWQLPVIDFHSDTNVQILCQGNSILLTNYSTSSNANDPFQKDRIQALGVYSDVIITTPPSYKITKTAADVNGGALVTGDQVEYTITATNLGSNLSNFVFTDPIPTGGTYVSGSTKVTINGSTYTMTDAADSPDTGGCPVATHCEANFNITTAGAVTFSNDWLYAMGSTAPLYDTIVIKFKVTFATLGPKSNQGRGVTRELANQQRTDDPNVNDGSDCTTGGVDNCNDSITGNDDPTIVTVIPPPPDVDLAITKTDGVTTVIPGTAITYTIVASNAGPNPALLATVSDIFPASLSGISWTCSASLGSTCTAAGVGNINDALVNLLSGGTATYTVNANTNSSATGTLVNTATITAPITVNETNPTNNSATDTDTYSPTDYGDAPDPTYPTLLANDGARHTIVTGKYLGSGVDQEPNGIPNSTATGDDLNNTDDEDGVVFNTALTQGNNDNITVTASAVGKLDAWVDFDADGNWTDPGEQIFTNQSLSIGANPLIFPVPPGATLGNTFARFRYSTAGGLGFIGLAADGEVEDYQVTIFAPPDLSTSTKADDDGDDIVDPLQTITYTITLVNTGGVTATSVNVDDVLDSDLENLNVISTNNCGAPGNTNGPAALHLNNISVAVGTNCVITFTAMVQAGTAGGSTVPNTATVSAASEGGSGAIPSSDTLTVATIPNLSTSIKSDNDGDNNVSNGQTVTYTITLINTGNGTGTNVTVDDNLNVNLENLSNINITNCGATPNSSGSTSTSLNVTGIDVSVSPSNCVITFTADVTMTAINGTTIPNSATISAASEGGTGANPSSDLLTVNGSVNFSTASKSHGGDGLATPGEIVTYTIAVPNTGTANASGITVTDNIDTHFGIPNNFIFSNCGSPSTNFAAPTLTFSNLTINLSTTCLISYDVQVVNPINENYPDTIVINNSANVSPANGAGNPLTASALTVDVTPNISTSTKADDDGDNMVDPGQSPITYTITLNNTGNGTGTGVHLTDTIDSNFVNFAVVSINSCGTNYTDSSGVSMLDITDLRVDVGTPCTVVYTVDVDAPLPGGTTINNSASVSAATEGGSGATLNSDTLTVISTPNLSTSTKSDDDADDIVNNGQTITYTLNLINTGNATGTGISVDDILDADLENLILNPIPGSCGVPINSSTSTELHLSNIQVAVGFNCQITFTATVKMSAVGGASIPNSSTISAATEGGSGATPSSDLLTVIYNPDLSTSTKADSDSDNVVEPDQTYTYTITIKNTGNTTAHGVDIDDTLDSDLDNLQVTGITNCGSPTNSSTSTFLNIDGATIDVGIDCIISFTVKVNSGVTGGSTITNSATISPATEGGSGANPSSSALTVASIPDLSTSTKVDDDVDNNVANSQTITYTITVKNTGNATGTGVNLDETIDDDLENLNVSSMLNCGPAVDNSTSTVLNIDNASISVGTDCVITYTADVKLTAPSASVIPNSVTISPAAEGGNGATPTSDTLAINSNINFFGSVKTDNDTDNIISPSNTVTYTISIDNSGNANATNFQVTDEIDTAFGTPFNFNYSGCGTPNSSFAADTLTFDNVDINAFSNCQISYTVTVDSPVIDNDPDNRIVTNSANIIPANGSATMTADDLALDVTPNLTNSSKTEDDLDNQVEPGQTVLYTIAVNNSGNGTATGVDIDDDLDTNLGNLTVISVNNCGTSYIDSSTAEPPVLEIDNIKVDPGTPCTVIFTASVDTPLANGININNTATISSANEGGSGDAVSSSALVVANTPVVISTSSSVTGAGGPYGKPSSEGEASTSTAKNPLQSCLVYDPNRDLTFSDLINHDRTFVKAATVLKGTKQTATGNYVISGFSSTTNDFGTRLVGLKDKMTRLEWTKLLMISHCLKISNAMELPARTINGNLMPNYADLPREHNGNADHDWQVDVMYSGSYFEIINGTLQNKVELGRHVTIPEAIKMMVRVGELITGEVAPRADHLVNLAIDREAWYFEFYSKAAAEGVFSQLINSAGTVNSMIVRGPAVYELLKTMLLRNLYVGPDESSIQQFMSDIATLS